MNLLHNLQLTFAQAKKSAFYRHKYAEYAELGSMEDFTKLPFTTKEELRALVSPYDFLATNEAEVVQINTTSGTTGTPTFSFYTRSDLELGSKEVAKAWRAFGVAEKSRVQFIMSYGLFSGASQNTQALQTLGALVIPAGIQPLKKQLQYISMFRPDMLVGTPSFFMHLYSVLRENDALHILKEWSVRSAIAAGEIYSEDFRQTLEKNLGIRIYNHYGLCEVYSGFAYECQCRNGLHLLDGLVYGEIVDPKTGVLLPDGEVGELVVTSIHKEATPIIRYRTGDITCRVNSSDRCRCTEQQQTTFMIDRIHQRKDDLVFVKGIKIDPHLVRDFLIHEFGSYIHSDLQIRVSGDGDFSPTSLYISLRNDVSEDFLKTITEALREETLVQFTVKHVAPDYFARDIQNKVKLIVIE